jgi:predicted ATPase/DNA-binding XRE family transcriptional regulator
VSAADQGAFATRLRLLRESAGLSQEELAERAGLSSHAISALERGARTRPYPHTVRALADALGASDADRASLITAVPARSRASRPAGDAAPVRARELPVPPTRLLGRDTDIARVEELIRAHRLVTLTGTGGVGKTRLALAVAADVSDRFADGVVYVELAPLLEPGAVLPAIADAVGAAAVRDADLSAVIAERLGDQQVLLVLDNFEHLVAAAPQIAALIEAVPGLTVLSTSRAPLRVRGEVELTVDPLALRDGGGAASPAVRLLLERADSVSQGWGTTPGDAPVVAAICERLAGIPLAIELAAARCRLLDPRALHDRLDTAVLDGARDLPARQRTMRATLDWSYGLLRADEQELLRLLAVFVGGFRLDDLEDVAVRAPLTAPAYVLHLLEALAEQSLVVSEPTSTGGRRYRLLEPVAQYARARLDEAGDAERFAAAHRAHFVALAEETGPHYQDGGQVAALARIDAEHANLTAAIERSIAAGDGEAAGRACWSLWMYWWLRGHHAHGRRLSEAALAQELPAAVRPRTELAAATMAFAMDDVPSARQHWLAAEAHAGDDEVARANSVAGAGLAALAVGDLVVARKQFESAIPHAEAGGPAGEWTAGLARIWLGTVDLLDGDPDQAVAQIELGLASARRRGDRLSTYIALYNLSQVELTRGRHAEARRHLEEGVRLSLETGDLANLAYLLDATAVLEAADGTHSRVPLLVGAAQAIREGIGAHGYGYYRPDPDALASACAEAGRRLGSDRYDDAVDVGRAMEPDEAAGLALGERAAVG